MSVTNFEIGIVLLLAAVNLSSTNPGNIIPVRKLLFDTDAGGDDAFAILMALEAERIDQGPKIVGITCVNGNTNVDNVALNVLKTLKVVDRLDIPVYKGTSHPILLQNEKSTYFGIDGFGDFDYPDPPSVDLIQSKHAVNAMIDLVKAHPGEVTLLALGPLTNVALAIRMYPSFLDELQQLIIMGGSTENLGSARPGIEFNFATDPAANYIVFNSTTSKLATLLPWEIDLRNNVTMEFRWSFRGSNGNITRLINLSDQIFSEPELEYWSCPDVLATAIALTSGSVVSKSGTYHSEAIYDGSKTAGMIIVDYSNVTGNAANTNLIQGIDTKVFKELLSRYFLN